MNDVVGKNDFVSRCPDLVAEDIVVGIIIGGGCNATDRIQRVAAEGNGGAQRKANSFKHIGNNYARWHFDRHADGFEDRPEVTCGISAIEAAHQSKLTIE